jgi:YD repeat-containing protein
MNMPAMGISDANERLTGLRTRAANAVKVTANETGNLVKIRITRKPAVCKGKREFT